MTAKEILAELKPLGRESYKRVLMNNHGVREPCFGVAISEPWLARIPLPAVAGVLVMVAIALMSGFKALDLKKPRQTVELLATVLVAVFFGLFYAVLTGAGLAFYHRALDHPQKHIPPILEDS